MTAPGDSPVRKRRPRYSGTHPRRFEEKYKELAPEKYPEAVAHVIASGKTPAGMHRPIMVNEIIEVLQPRPGLIAVDATLGYGGHAREILEKILPGGKLIGVDADPLELPKTEERFRGWQYGPECFSAHRSNFAGLPGILAQEGVTGVDLLLADLGCSSMQFDNPARGFSVKLEGPLDMRMNPGKGRPASAVLKSVSAEELEELLKENADEPEAWRISQALAGKELGTTLELAEAIRRALPRFEEADLDAAIRRVFQALRIEVNDEFTALDQFLRILPGALNPGGRVAILTFHSGEDRRVKKAFENGRKSGLYSELSEDVIRPSPEERRSNPRSIPAKLRWACRTAS